MVGPRHKIVITGIAGRLGRLLARRLHRDYPVVGIYRRDFPGKPRDIDLGEACRLPQRAKPVEPPTCSRPHSRPVGAVRRWGEFFNHLRGEFFNRMLTVVS